MQLDLTRIREAETPFAKVFEPEALAVEGDPFRITGPVELTMVVHKDADRYRLVGQVRGQLELACSRCLEPFAMTFEPAFDLRYLPQHLNVGGHRDAADEDEDHEDEDGAATGGEVGDGDLTTSFYGDDQIDLVQLIREQMFLAMPMKPLHSDDCRGLCPTCGANLNETTCDCRTEWIDPRLAPLRNLK